MANALLETRCTCGSDMLTYAGGYPLTCTESFFHLLDDGILDDNGWSRPRFRGDRLPSREHVTVLQHLLDTLVDEPV